MPKILKVAIFSILLIVFISFISLMAIGLSGKRPVTGQSGFTLIGNTAPDFNLILFDGNEFTLSDYYGSPIVLNFCSWFAISILVPTPSVEATITGFLILNTDMSNNDAKLPILLKKLFFLVCC